MNISLITKMKHSPIHNYAGIPGLTSWLIGERSHNGCVRLFECERNHDESIIPHSHRFDFECFVLEGEVRNVIYHKIESPALSVNNDVDSFASTELIYGGSCGTYSRGDRKPFIAKRIPSTYKKGDTYKMSSNQVHSIYFSKGAKVLFFEGPQLTDRSIILEPFANGEHVPTFKVEPWMFKKPEPKSAQESANV